MFSFRNLCHEAHDSLVQSDTKQFFPSLLLTYSNCGASWNWKLKISKNFPPAHETKKFINFNRLRSNCRKYYWSENFIATSLIVFARRFPSESLHKQQPRSSFLLLLLLLLLNFFRLDCRTWKWVVKIRGIFVSGNRRIGSDFKFVRFSLLSLFHSDGIRLDSPCEHITHIGGVWAEGRWILYAWNCFLKIGISTESF